MKPRYPIYIPSKGRAGESPTVKMFNKHGVDFHVVVEPQDFDDYASKCGTNRNGAGLWLNYDRAFGTVA